MSGHPTEGRPDEKLEGDHARHRVSREAEEEMPMGFLEGERLPGTHVALPEVEVHPQRRDGLADEVAVPYRHAGRRHQHVGLEARAETLHELVAAIAGNPETQRGRSSLG